MFIFILLTNNLYRYDLQKYLIFKWTTYFPKELNRKYKYINKFVELGIKENCSIKVVEQELKSVI